MKRFSHVIIMAIMMFLCVGYVYATGTSAENNVRNLTHNGTHPINSKEKSLMIN